MAHYADSALPAPFLSTASGELRILAAGSVVVAAATASLQALKSPEHPHWKNFSSSYLQPIRERMLQSLALSNPLAPPAIPSTLRTSGILDDDLPRRKGPRPMVETLHQHRQTTQLPPPESDVRSALLDLLTTIHSRSPTQTYLGRSTYENGPITLYAKHHAFNTAAYLGCIVRADADAGFLHLTLHPADVRTVLESGWGERHPLSNPWAERLLGPMDGSGVTGCHVLVYAPRDGRELAVVERVVRAAVWWAGGIETPGDHEPCDDWSDLEI